MNLYIVAAFIALTAAAQLPSRNYLPPGQGQSSGYGGNGFSGNGFTGNGLAGNENTRPQQAQEKRAAILKQENDVSDNGDYRFGFETENGIRAEESGKGDQAQGGYSYKGDDGITYTVTYTAGEGGFRPQGAHLPVPPPTPKAILEALQQNERDEAAGIFDDGQYRPDVHGGPNNKPGQNGQFGNQYGGNGNHQNGFNPNTGYTY